MSKHRRGAMHPNHKRSWWERGVNPRVTLAIPVYNAEPYLGAAIESCLAQDYQNFELLLVNDCSTDASRDIIARFNDPRIRLVDNPRNLGFAGSNNVILREARGELIANMGNDDVIPPDRLRRQVAIFDQFPDTGVVHGAATLIDATGTPFGVWPSADYDQRGWTRILFRHHNLIVYPSTMVHRRVFEATGEWDESLKIAGDLELWLRALAKGFRFRNCGPEPLVLFRRHGANASDESQQDRERAEVTLVMERGLDLFRLRDVVPELDWPLYGQAEGEHRALVALANAVERRQFPLPELAAHLRARAHTVYQPAPRRNNGKRIMLTSFGWNDSGGGTMVPRYVAKELSRRGWDVSVFHAAVGKTETGIPYEIREWDEDGVHLIGVFNRPHGLLDLGNPRREVDDPPITQAFGEALDRFKPDVVHFHNLHNLGSALLDQTSTRGIPAYFSTHNYWLACPRNYLFKTDLALCAGPGNRGGDCASCVGSSDVAGYQFRQAEIRSRFSRSINACLAVSDAVRQTLIATGYPAEMIDVVRQGVPSADATWEQLGRNRAFGRVGDRLTVAFFGSAYPHKGPQLLVEAAQLMRQRVRVLMHGEISPQFAEALRVLDRRGVVELRGAFSPSELPSLLADVDVAVLPSMWWDCAPLMAGECLAGRVPVVAARMGGLMEAVTDERDGLLFNGRSAADLARQLDRLASERGLLERLQSQIEAPRSFSAYVDDLEAYYAGARPCQAEIFEKPLAVRWVGDHRLNTSLSIINQRVTSELEKSGVRVERVERSGLSVDPPLPHVADVEVRHQWPPDFRPAASGRLAVIQPWEFGSIPLEWVEQINTNVDEVWVPSEFARQMYVRDGVAEDRVRVLPNGVDPRRFSPEGRRYRLRTKASGTRFLFVGGWIGRKGPDVLFDAYRAAFAGRDDVTLVVKDFGANGVYRGQERDVIRSHAASGALPRVEYIDRELSDSDMADLYRACDVLVHPYRGEGFGMPVLEAMACGKPVIVTAGGPTDEFCPDEACWRIPSSRMVLPNRIDRWETVQNVWMLEPDADALRHLLVEADRDVEGRARRGTAAHAAAEAYTWSDVGTLYLQCLRSVSELPLKSASPGSVGHDLEENVAARVLATPAWRGNDRLPELLKAWSQAAPVGTSACLYLLADPRVDGQPEALGAHVMQAAATAGVNLDGVADIVLLARPFRAGLHEGLFASIDAYVPLHLASAGYERLAERAGITVLAPDQATVGAWLSAHVGTQSLASAA